MTLEPWDVKARRALFFNVVKLSTQEELICPRQQSRVQNPGALTPCPVFFPSTNKQDMKWSRILTQGPKDVLKMSQDSIFLW